MERVKFPKGKQVVFLEKAKKRFNLDNKSLARIFRIKTRTLSDWQREKSTMNYASMSKFCKKFNEPFPKNVKVLPEFWYIKKASSLGAKIRYELYGNPGTPEGRKKGGLATMKKMMADPKLAKTVGFKRKKNIVFPRDKSQLAEFIGIVLGDGSLFDYWVKVTFNRVTDKEYGIFVQNIIKRLFGISSNIVLHKSDKSADVVVYSRMLTDYLVRLGLKRGNKVRNNVDIPFWIKQNSRLCLNSIRGLADTDGSFYAYNNTAGGNKYKNFAFCLTNRAVRLLDSVYTILKNEGFSATRGKDRVYLYKKEDIIRYFQVIGSHNYKHVKKYRNFMGLIS